MVEYGKLWRDISHGGEPKTRHDIPPWRIFDNTDLKTHLTPKTGHRLYNLF